MTYPLSCIWIMFCFAAGVALELFPGGTIVSWLT